MHFSKFLEQVAANEFKATLLALAIVLIASAASFYAVKRWAIRAIVAAIRRTKNEWDDQLVNAKVFDTLAYLAPVVVIYYTAPFFHVVSARTISKVLILYVVINTVILVRKLLLAGLAIYQAHDVAKKRPIKGYIQVLVLVDYIVGGIFVVSFALDHSPWGVLTGLGAMTAVLLLVFRDTILSFVASIEIASNDMVRIGDWIEMPQFGADGDVVDMALHTLKVQNFDKTIVTIPTHKLIDGSFKNWRGMSEAGGRRIMRSLLVDQRSVRFLLDEEIEALAKIELLRPYLEAKQAEIAKDNQEKGVDETVPVNGRRMTNIGTFRAYVEAYLKACPHIRQDMTFLVRQLAPTERGVPLQIYVFTDTTAWIAYEAIQGDIFDHLIAAAPHFYLRLYQDPTGHDIAELAQGPRSL